VGEGWLLDGRRVLDFGCGSGRVLRQFAGDSDRIELHGCDIDERCVDWVREHLDGVHAIRSAERPPLPYPDHHFDLVWCMSVFSHLTDTWSAWLLELHRVLKPDGLLLATVIGPAFAPVFAGEPGDADRIGMTALGYGRPWHAGGPMVLHAEWWVRAHWGRAFDILTYEDGGICEQDAVLMRRREAPGLVAADLERPEPGEPRELSAALHAVELHHREYAELNAAHDAYAEAYSQEARRREELERALAAAEATIRELRARQHGIVARAARRVRQAVRR
jgi:SAM-dependent methyltransferase